MCLSIINLMSVCALFFIILVGKSSPYHFNASFPLIVMCESWPCGFHKWVTYLRFFVNEYFLVTSMSEYFLHGYDVSVTFLWF